MSSKTSNLFILIVRHEILLAEWNVYSLNNATVEGIYRLGFSIEGPMFPKDQPFLFKLSQLPLWRAWVRFYYSNGVRTKDTDFSGRKKEHLDLKKQADACIYGKWTRIYISSSPVPRRSLKLNAHGCFSVSPSRRIRKRRIPWSSCVMKLETFISTKSKPAWKLSTLSQIRNHSNRFSPVSNSRSWRHDPTRTI